MQSSTKTWVAGLVAGALGVAIGFGLGWAWQDQKLNDATSQAAVLKAKAAGLQTSVQRLTKEKLAAEASASAAAAAAAVSGAQTQTAPATSKPKPAGESGKKFGYVKSVKSTSKGKTLSLDAAIFLTGDAAAKAAKARGDESPPPNDYYIVNDTTKLTTYPIASNATVKLVVTPDGWDAEGYAGTIDDFVSIITDPTSPLTQGKSSPWWITLKNGTVVKIEQQYLP